MATEDLVQAFLVGRNAYLTTPLAYQGFLDQATNQFRCQIAPAGSQVWADWLTVDASGSVSIPSLSSSGLNLPWSHVTGTPTTLAGYGITDPVVLTSGSYADPAWLSSLAGAKITGTVPAATVLATPRTIAGVSFDGSANIALASTGLSDSALLARLASPAFTGTVTFGGPLTLKGYTVATLPAGAVGQCAYATDLLAPGFLVAAVGGGGVTGPVFYDGVSWKAF